MSDIIPKIPDIRTQIEALEAHLLTLPQVQLECRHYFADGLYGRELHIPAGTVLTGAIHKREHINIIIKGKIEVATESGSKIVEGPCVIVSPPGTKRVGIALEDTIWMTVHAAHSTTITDAERELVTNTRAEYEALGNIQMIEEGSL
jgi:hypothetical protein